MPSVRVSSAIAVEAGAARQKPQAVAEILDKGAHKKKLVHASFRCNRNGINAARRTVVHLRDGFVRWWERG